MSDQAQTPEEETFTFVDKRRTVDPALIEAEEALPAEPQVDFSEQTDDDELLPDELDSASSQGATIYDIAAYVTGMLATDAFQRLGLLADPQTGSAKMDLPQAKFAIDCVSAMVGVIDTPGCLLPEAIRREMKRTLNDLRLNYVDRAKTA